LESIGLLAMAAELLGVRCVEGIEADESRATDLMGRTVMAVTALAPLIGYDLAAEIAARATAENRTVRSIALEMGVLPEQDLDVALDMRRMTEGGVSR
jgi:fumarate hydratase class II